jgi:hypothetical protein
MKLLVVMVMGTMVGLGSVEMRISRGKRWGLGGIVYCRGKYGVRVGSLRFAEI